MEGNAAGMSAKTTAAPRPPSPVDRLQEEIINLGNTVDSLQNCLARTYGKLYGEYQYGPRNESELPESAGHIGEIHQSVRNIRQNAELAMEVAEALEANT
jgi:hypothetical protein